MSHREGDPGEMRLTDRIEKIIRPHIEMSGLTLYDIEFQGRTLRISIEKTGGVSLEDCVETSRMLNPLLDVEDVVPGGRYELEVSSPGLNRPLRRPEHFAAALGTRIHVTTYEPLSKWNLGEYFEKRKNVTGELKSFDGTTLKIDAEGLVVTIPLGAIAKSRVDFELKTTPKNKMGKKV